ncbi:MAG: hypothetical protein MN733_30315, partial [Nitrososphaera sp.]|nr:hypothetical protein [Nitrososphaera sp.]
KAQTDVRNMKQQYDDFAAQFKQIKVDAAEVMRHAQYDANELIEKTKKIKEELEKIKAHAEDEVSARERSVSERENSVKAKEAELGSEAARLAKSIADFNEKSARLQAALR